MRRFVFALVALAVALAASPAAAVTGGRPDDGAHPQVAFIYAPGVGFCSGTLIAPRVVLTAGHCTDFFDAEGVRQVLVSFDDWSRPTPPSTRPGAGAPTPTTSPPIGRSPSTSGSSSSTRRSTYRSPRCPSRGCSTRSSPTTAPATKPSSTSATARPGSTPAAARPRPAFPLQRRQSTQAYAPGGNDLVGVLHGLTDLLLMLKASPSARHGSGCGGDSGGPIFLGDSFTLVAIHTGGYRLGVDDALCGRLSSLNHRLDTPAVLDWLAQFL